MNKPDPKIRATPRVMRVAYVLEGGEDVHGWLDAIFADCFSRDGGRQSLVVPLIEGRIPDRYKAWLRVLDPDFVLLLTYDNNSLVDELTAMLGDTQLLERKRDRDRLEAHPRVGIDRPIGLTALSWLPFLKAVSGLQHTPPTQILDRYPRWVDDGLIKDNFGTLYDSLTSFPVHNQIGMRAALLTPENPPENRWHFRSVDGVEMEDAYEVLSGLSNRGGIATLAQLSNLRTQPNRHTHPWANGFCLVVGDTFEDRVSCWNAGLLFQDAQSQTYKTLRLPEAAAFDAEKVASVGQFLRNCNWLGSGNGPPRVFVRSHSIDAARLERLLVGLREVSRSNVTFEEIPTLDDCCPLDAAQLQPVFNALTPDKVSAETAISGPTVMLSAPSPLQVSYCAGLHPVFSQGAWFVDLSMDRLNDVGRFSNVREIWLLPRRQQLVRYFCEVAGARVTKGGGITLPITIESRAVEIKQPDDSEIFQSLLVDRPHFQPHELRGRVVREAPYRYTEPSDKGSYLQGLIGMFGSLNDIEHALSVHFWRKQFENMAAPAQSQYAEVIRDIQLRMQARDGKLVIDDEAGWQNLAQRIVQKASRLKVPRLRTRYGILLREWTAELTAAIEKDANLKLRREEVLGECEDDLKRSLGYLFERGVMHRGHEWSCVECRHRNWLGVEALKEKMSCEVCGRQHQLPVDIALDFRMNEFFATCLREHDTVTVAWALTAMRRRAKRSFMYAPQTALYRDFPENQGGRIDRELDLVCIVDGKFAIGEVKVSSELIANSDIEDLATAAKEVGAQVAVLAAVRGTPALMERKIQALRALLPTSIETQWLLSDWDDEPSYHL